ncbi:response regulator [Sporosarcina sp. SAFN-015]|uniref:response regulator n=1 Tax=Sporosarcina sp. SAFN-015 TaxID=3387274 RepID=UPI003F812A69
MKIVIIDDHPLVRKGLTAILSLEHDIEILGEAANGKEGLLVLNSLKPDLTIVDLRLGDESGLDLIAEARRQGATCKFVVLTSSTDKEDFRRAKEMEVDGYVLKEALPEEMLHALRMINRGRTYYDQGVLEFVMKPSTSYKSEKQTEVLTPKEMEVLMELGKGFSNKEISQKMYITEYTVKKHVSQVLAKLELADRTHAALYANATGLVRYVVN